MRRAYFLAAWLLGVPAVFAQTVAGVGPLNLFGLNDYATTPYQTTSGKTAASGPAAGVSTGVFIILGQSIPSNMGVSLYTPTNATHCFNLNIYTGTMYQLSDPVLGATGTAGSYIGRLCDKLINDGKYTNVVMIPGAIGGTTVGQWTSGGAAGLYISGGNNGWFSHRLVVTINRTRQAGYTPNAILWDQGNQDAANGTSSVAYQAGFNNLVATAQGAGYSGKWMIATETMLSNATNATIQGAQAAVVGGNVIAGANIDSLTGGTNRQADGTHLTDTGNASAANLWAAVIEANL